MRLLFLFWFLILRTSLAVSADLAAPVDIDFKPEPISKLLTQQTVTQMFQDSRGAIWFITQEGLNRYNGLELENFRYSPTDQGSISSNAPTGITEDSHGLIWITTLGGGLNKYDARTNSFSALYASSNRSQSPLYNDIYNIFKPFGDVKKIMIF